MEIKALPLRAWLAWKKISYKELAEIRKTED